MAIPYPIPDPLTGQWDPFALKRNLEYLDQSSIKSTATSGIRSFSLVMKTVDETVNNTSTLQTDDQFIVSMGPSEQLVALFHLRYQTQAAAGIKFGLSVPTAAALVWYPMAGGKWAMTTGTWTSVNELGTASTVSYFGNGSGQSADLVVWTGARGTGGTFALQWAQDTADATNTKVLTTSWMLLWRLTQT